MIDIKNRNNPCYGISSHLIHDALKNKRKYSYTMVRTIFNNQTHLRIVAINNIPIFSSTLEVIV
jgi:hypothetical protein